MSLTYLCPPFLAEGLLHIGCWGQPREHRCKAMMYILWGSGRVVRYDMLAKLGRQLQLTLVETLQQVLRVEE